MRNSVCVLVFDFSDDEIVAAPGASIEPTGTIGVVGLQIGSVTYFDVSSSDVGSGGTGQVSQFKPTNSTALAADPDLAPLGIDDNPNIDPNNLGLPAVQLPQNELIGITIGEENGEQTVTPNASSNSLLLQETNAFESGGVDLPDDTGSGGSIVLTVAQTSPFPLRLDALTFVDDVDATVSTIIGGVTTTIGEILIDGPNGASCGPDNTAGDNCGAGLDFTGVSDLLTTLNQGDSIVVNFDGSGAFMGLGVTEVPVPPAVTLMLTGLAGLGIVARRRRKKAAI